MAATQFNADEKDILKRLFCLHGSTRLRFVSLKNFSMGTSFSSSILIGKRYKDWVSIVDLFSNIRNAFKNPDDLDEEAKMALKRLLEIRTSGPTLVETLAGSWQTESEFNVFLATNVIQPLTGGICIINSVKDKTAIENSDVKLPADLYLPGIAMGYADGYYGEPDILACPKKQSQKVERPGAGTVAIQSASTVVETDIAEESDETGADGAQHAKKRKSNEEQYTE